MRIKFFEDCLITNGFRRSIIVDTTRGKLDAIPNSLYNFIKETNTFSIEDIKKEYSNDDCEIIDEYLDFLIQNEYMFFLDDLFINNFPAIELKWDYPAKISNTIISFQSKTWKRNIEKIIFFLNEINCQDIEIRFEDAINEKEIKDLILYFEKSRVSTVNLILPFIKVTNVIYDILSNYLRLEKIIFYNFQNDLINKQKPYKTNQIQITTKNLDEIFKITNINQFEPNLKLFAESKQFHTYFNRKLYFGVNGEIKSAPESNLIFENIENITEINEFKHIIDKESFKKYWEVNKVNCDVCKDCEFRNICVDNRLPFKRNNGSWYHKEECNYNPYISKWVGEENYSTLLNMGIISDENNFTIDYDKIKFINDVINLN
jgi:SPASM domain peptide maturase of grasp-with-spasm system